MTSYVAGPESSLPKYGRSAACVGGGGREERMREAGRCPRERPGPRPEVAREDRVPTGEVIAESRPMGAGKEPWPAVAEAVGRIAEMEFLVVADPDSDSVVGPGGARGCTTSEGNSQGGGGCRTGCGTQLLVSSLGTRSEINCRAGGVPSVICFVWEVEPGSVGRTKFE